MRYANDPEIERQIGAFGENMRAARRRAGMTQTELAAVDGLDRAAISLTEKGKRSPDMRTLLRIAEGLNVTAAELVRGIGPFARGQAQAGASNSRPDPDSGAGERAGNGRSPTAAATSKRPGKRNDTRFSQNLHRARLKAGISQQRLGAHADVDAAAISLYERGQRQPNLRTIFKLARTLEVSPVDLLRDVR